MLFSTKKGFKKNSRKFALDKNSEKSTPEDKN